MRTKLLTQTLFATVITVLICANTLAQVQEQRLAELTDKDYEAAMQGMADNFLSRFDKMPRIRFVLKDDRRFYNDKGQLHALAFYTRDEAGKPVIYVNPGYTNRAKYPEMVDTVLHELTHAWVDWRGLGDKTVGGHGEAFIKKVLEIGLNLTSTLATYSESRAIYERLTTNSRGRDRDAVVARGKHDPAKDTGYFGENIFDFQFIPFDYGSDGKSKSIRGRENVLLRVLSKPELEQRFLRRNKSWRVYSITGSIVWLTEAVIPVARIAGVQRNSREWHFNIPADTRWYAITLPQAGKFNLKRVRGNIHYVVELRGDEISMGRGNYLEITVGEGEVFHVGTKKTGDEAMEICFKLIRP